MTTIKENVDFAQQLWKLGLENEFRVIQKKAQVGYDSAREISNSRFDHKPDAIAFPKTSDDVSCCVKFCNDNNLKFRVCSGGHQHEGMSSLDGGVVIRLSELNQITYPDSTKEKAWIPTGKPLKDVYDELQIHYKTIPGGGCYSVNVGGLTLGGGWGTSARKMGLTCDSFEEAEVVLADGEIVNVKAENKYKDLFWALRGGGGGNFGIVTKFLFQLHSIGDYITTVNFRWKKLGEKETKIVEWYLDNQKNFPKELTSVLSLRVKHEDMRQFENLDGKCALVSNYSALAFVGKFYGTEADLRDIFEKNDFLKQFTPDNKETTWFKQNAVSKKAKAEKNAPKELINQPFPLLSEIISDFVDSYTGVSENDETFDITNLSIDSDANLNGIYKKLPPPNVTCLAPHPHKISSGYPKKGKHAELARKMVKIVKDTNEQNLEGVRLFMVLHGMPGESAGIKSDESAFYYRDKDLLLQFQSWWENPAFSGSLEGSEQSGIDKKGNCKMDYNSFKFQDEWKAYKKDKEGYINWITESRATLSGELEGAFINFVDKDIPLEEYYGKNFKELKRIKSKYDSKNVLSFPMSIPLK